MATIRRHPVPPESYEPNRPLNDLGHDQFRHFVHVAERLPEDARAKLPPVPSPEDGMAASNFIAAVTRLLLERKAPPLRIVSRRASQPSRAGLSLAATASPAPVETTKPGSHPHPRPNPTDPAA